MSNFRDITIASTTLAAAQQGDALAHEAIFREMAPAVFTTAMRIVGDVSKAEDVLQETFIEVLRSVAQFRGDSSLATWVRHIVVSKSLMLIRTAWEQRAQSMAGLDEPRSTCASPGTAPDLERALAQLDDKSRAVVWLHDVEGFTHGEIADYLGQSVSFSKSRLQRAHKILREYLRNGYAPIAAEPLETVAP